MSPNISIFNEFGAKIIFDLAKYKIWDIFRIIKKNDQLTAHSSRLRFKINSISISVRNGFQVSRRNDNELSSFDSILKELRLTDTLFSCIFF